MASRMQIAWSALTIGLVVGVVGLVFWLNAMPASPAPTPGGGSVSPAPALTGSPLRLGLVPERDIFAQRRRHRALADYLAGKLGRPVELVTVNTYSGVLEEIGSSGIDAAFVGSMVAVLAHDRYGARVLCKPQMPDGRSTYRGVIIVGADSPIQRFADLAGRSIALVRTTTAGDLYPHDLLVQHDMLDGERAPRIHWVGTHDEVVNAVAAGDVDAGAVKDLRLDALQRADPTLKLRRLATSRSVPSNALIVRADVPAEATDRLASLLLTMHETSEGGAALEAFGATRFLPCSIDEYAAVYDMADHLGDHWPRVGVEGPRPQRPAPEDE